MKKITLLLFLLTSSLLVSSKITPSISSVSTQGIKSSAKAPVHTLASGDTLLYMPLPTSYINPIDLGGFTITKVDGDLLTAAAQALQTTSWGLYYSTALSNIDPTQGDVDTGYFYGANSWFSAPGKANNWLIIGPITIPAAGATLSWKIKELDPDFMDGYEVLASTSGGTVANFTTPALYTIGDNDPVNDTVWISHSLLLNAPAYLGQQVYIAFHHNAFDMNALFLDNILITENASTTVANDECSGATDINSVFGGAINSVQAIGPFDNTLATTSAQDPTSGYECFGEPDGTGSAPELNNTLWFTFTGDGSTYFIESGTCNGVTSYISDGDTQFGLYTGSCGNFTPVDCNEDGPNATATLYPAGLTVATSPGTVYYLMVDGFSFQGTPSIGEFCLLVNKVQSVTCNDPSITAGTVTQNTGSLCFGDTVNLSASGAVAPNAGGISGFSWVVSNADISGTHDPLDPTTLVASYAFVTTAPAISNITFINDTSFLTAGTYYWTPVVFGNAIDGSGTAQFLSELTLDTSCVHAGTSMQVTLLAAGDSSCLPPVLTPANDECAGATDINSVFGGAINTVQAIGPFDNTLATTSAQDPTSGYECFGEPDGTGSAPELNNTLWFTFTGDGSTYFIESGTCNGVTSYISDGDTQFGLYTGGCGNFTPVDCNEDGPNATTTLYPAGLTVATTPGTVYYLMVDGFSFQGTPSIGEFCLLVNKVQSVTCNDPSITAGTVTQNTGSLCFSDTVNLSASGAVAPNAGGISGFSWVVSNADISGTHNPLDPATLVASYAFVTTAPSISNITFINDTSFLTAGTYYWTPIVFGNAVDGSGTAQFLNQLTLDTSCVHAGTSMQVTLLAPGDSSCLPPVVTPANDECAGATDINSVFGGAINIVQAIGPFDNTLATTSAQDPTSGYECFGEPDGTGSAPELNNTLWFTFTGDGSTYFIESGTCNGVTSYISDGDTQFGLYTGGCGNFTPVDCNEDGPNATATAYPAGITVATTPGTVYYLMVDGFSFQGTPSIGEFCLLVNKVQSVTCNDPSITAGTVTQNTGNLCFGDTVNLSASGAVAPNAGGISGFSWVISNVDISGTHNPLDANTFVASYAFSTSAPAVSNLSFVNDTSFLVAGTYYWTPVVFGNAVDGSGTAQYLSQLTLDTACVHTGTSMQVVLLAPGDTSCLPPVVSPVNDECVGAVDINSAFGGILNTIVSVGPYDNTLATTSAQDPTIGFECFGEPDGTGSAPELNNNLWFTFNGDGETYYIESGTCGGVINYISDGDTQFGLYTGTCGNLAPLACNEDGPNATSTTYPAGLTVATTNNTAYYLMVDGFNFQGTLASGEYCILVKRLTVNGISQITSFNPTELSIYPSPVSDKLNVQFVSTGKGNSVVKISDITGREVQKIAVASTVGFTKLALDVKNLASGVYWISVQDDQVIRTVKFLKK